MNNVSFESGFFLILLLIILILCGKKIKIVFEDLFNLEFNIWKNYIEKFKNLLKFIKSFGIWCFVEKMGLVVSLFYLI